MNKILLSIIFILLLSHCSTNVPEIRDSFVQVNLFNDIERGIKYQKLSLFIIPFDGDGFEDLSVIYILNDKEELYWAVESDEWINGDNRGNKWIGTNSIIMPELKDFPKGEYRLVLEDLSGESVDRSIYVSYTDIDKHSYNFPKPYTEENKLFIKITSQKPEIWVYNLDKYINAYSVESTGLNRNIIISGQNEGDLNYYIYYYDSKYSMGIITGPFIEF